MSLIRSIISVSSINNDHNRLVLIHNVLFIVLAKSITVSCDDCTESS